MAPKAKRHVPIGDLLDCTDITVSFQAITFQDGENEYRVVDALLDDEVVRVRMRIRHGAVFVKSLCPPPEAQPHSVGALKR